MLSIFSCLNNFLDRFLLLISGGLLTDVNSPKTKIVTRSYMDCLRLYLQTQTPGIPGGMGELSKGM